MSERSEHPIALELTQTEFQRYVDMGADPKELHACMHDATLLLPRLVAKANARARKDKQMERVMRHYLVDCAARTLPIFEAYAPDNHHMRMCVEAGHLLAEGKIDQTAARETLKKFVLSFEHENMPNEPLDAALSIFLAVGWNWLEVEGEDTEMLQHAAWAVRFAFSAGGRKRVDRNWTYTHFIELVAELITNDMIDDEPDVEDPFATASLPH